VHPERLEHHSGRHARHLVADLDHRREIRQLSRAHVRARKNANDPATSSLQHRTYLIWACHLLEPVLDPKAAERASHIMKPMSARSSCLA
jgi:hypothetical protein